MMEDREEQWSEKLGVNNLTLFLATLALVIVLSVLTALFTTPLEIGETTIRWYMLTFWLGMAYVLFSWRFTNPVKPDEIAVRTFLGKPTDVIGSGPPFVPLGIFQLQILDIKVIQYEFPDEPENIFEGELKDVESLNGKKPPIRITFRNMPTPAEAVKILDKAYCVSDIRKIEGIDWADKSDEDFEKLEEDHPHTVLTFNPTAPKDGLSRRVTSVVTPVVRWRIEKDHAFDFIINIGDENAVRKQMEDEMVSVLQRLLPLMSVGQAMQNIAWINAHLLVNLIRRTRHWGIKIEGAYIKRIPLHHTLNDAIADHSEAEFRGNADKELAIQRGRGAAQAARDMEEQTLIGRAAGQKSIAENLGVSGAEVQAAEVARSVAEGGNTVVVGAEGFAQLTGIVKAMTGNKPKPEPKGKTQE